MGHNFWNNKRVLITGYEGFLGSWLASILVSKKAEVIGLDIVYKRPKSILKELRNRLICIKGDIADFKKTEKIINDYKPEFIFHLAAEAIVVRANKNPLRTFRSNVEGTWNILEACRGKSFVNGIIIASSDKAYGPQKNLPYTEDMPVRGVYPYDVSKSCTDLIATTYYNTYKLPVCITRCGNIYGPGDLNFSRIVPDAIKSILRKKRFVIRSDGKFTRDYIYVEDVVNGYLLLAEKMRNLKLYGEAFNFSNEKPITVLKLFKKIERISFMKVYPPKILNKAKYEIKHQYLSAKKAKSILGWLPDYSLEKGLIKTIAWYDKNI
ncbi:MAG: GDP-mannose 4,6-dehydratase [Candidatus Omnitrophica bacterium]|nr:GDP-mannose 4,6-dehydratase [Candidatus Omnitrophota bacterium]MDD5352377.1 GDP-mannose 4,6-dehydratase [Candidatus Omnitrophota bacterium]MDD5549975.1 GDP-mannose 4,6-dehydratase [Candidatus Omnitrophota bacterium]